MSLLTDFTERLFPLKPSMVGVDIADRSVKMAVLGASGGGAVLRSLSEAALPAGAIEGGVVGDGAGLSQAIGQCRDALGLRPASRWAVAAIPEEQVFIRLVSIPEMSAEELASAMAAEIEATIPLPRDEVYADWLVLPASEEGGRSGHRDVIIAAAPKKIVNSLQDIFSGLGIRLVAVEPESHALARVVARQEAASELESILIVDMGALGTRLALVVGGIVNFSTTFSASGEAMTKAIAEARRIKPGEAEASKQRFGIGTSAEGRAQFQILEPILKELTAQLQQAVRYWEEHVKHRHGAGEAIAKIVLAGGGAKLKGLAQFLSFHAGAPVQIINPAALFADASGTLDAVGYATAVGLGLRGLETPIEL